MQPVLIIEDDADEREAMRLLLEGAGYQVRVAADGREGLDMVMALKPEPFVVLLDLNMPRISGWELAAIMRSYRRLSLIPTVVVTAADLQAESRQIFEAVMQKPVRPADLL